MHIVHYSVALFPSTSKENIKSFNLVSHYNQCTFASRGHGSRSSSCHSQLRQSGPKGTFYFVLHCYIPAVH